MRKIKLRAKWMVEGIALTIFIIFIISSLEFVRHPKPRYESLTKLRPRHKHINDVGTTCVVDDVVQLVLVACKGKSGNTLKESLNVIKSAVLFTKCPLHVHIFTIQLKKQFYQEISRWPRRITQAFTLTIHSLVYPLSPEDTKEMMNWWGECASFRLFLPKIMPEVDAILYVDIDVMFLGPVEEIWEYFFQFNPSQVGALSRRVGWEFKVPQDNPNYIRMPNGKMTQVNSGVFLMNLTRMRAPVFKTSNQISREKQPWGRDFLFPLYRLNIKDMHGDQNLINVAFHYNPELLYFLPCRHNYQHKFCFDNYRERFCNSAEKDGAHTIHGSANTFYNNYAPPFRIINDVMTTYNFEDDLKKLLLGPVLQKLNHLTDSDHPHCANKSELFVKTLRKSIASFQNYH